MKIIKICHVKCPFLFIFDTINPFFLKDFLNVFEMSLILTISSENENIFQFSKYFTAHFLTEKENIISHIAELSVSYLTV